MPMPFFYVYIIMLQVTWSIEEDSSPPQEGWRTTTSSGSISRCLHDWNQKTKWKGTNGSAWQLIAWGEIRRWKAAGQHSKFLAAPPVPGITAGIVILVTENISINSNIEILQRAVRVLYNNLCQGLYVLRGYCMAIMSICDVIKLIIYGHNCKMRVLWPGGLTNLRLKNP